MDFRYSDAAMRLAFDCLDHVSPDEADALRDELDAQGEASWLSWEAGNRAEAARYLLATPAQKRRCKAWQDPAHRARLALAAHRLARLAGAMLELPGGWSGMPYRAAVDSALTLQDYALRQSGKSEWPFPVEPPVWFD